MLRKEEFFFFACHTSSRCRLTRHQTPLKPILQGFIFRVSHQKFTVQVLEQIMLTTAIEMEIL